MCNTPVPPYVEELAALAAEAAKDPNRPIYHFLPTAGWMNDVNGPLMHKGEYHIFYQHMPHDSKFGEGLQWGHTKSGDLIHWEHLPAAIWPDMDRGETGCWSGTACFNQRGEPMIFYTSARKLGAEREALEKFEQWAAIGDEDLIVWTKHPDNPILHLDRPDQPEFAWRWRDPYIFTEQGRTFMVVGAAGPGTPIYEAEDPGFSQWTYRGLLCDQSIECPNFFKLNDRWILITSPHDPVGYFIGDFDIENYRFEIETEGLIEETRTFYGTNVLFDERDRCIFLGRLRRNVENPAWNGCMGLPRVLSIEPDGAVRQRPVEELLKLRGHHTRISDMALAGSPLPIAQAVGDTIELIATIDPGGADEIGLAVRRSGDGSRAVTINYDGRTITAAGVEVPYRLAPGQQSITFQVFLDKSVIEVFVDDGAKVATNFIDCEPQDIGVAVYAHGGAARLNSLDAWTMKPIWG
jgi:beta-fructofuranosidase